MHELFFCKVFYLILYRFLVGVHRDIFECDLARCPHFLRINRQTLCHCFSPLYIDNNYLTFSFIKQQLSGNRPRLSKLPYGFTDNFGDRRMREHDLFDRLDVHLFIDQRVRAPDDLGGIIRNHMHAE